MKTINFISSYLLSVLVINSILWNSVNGEIRLRDILQEKDKKLLLTKKLKKANAESLKQFIKEIDSSGVIRKIIRRKLHIPKDSSLTLTSQVSRPNIFPNIFNQGDGFIVDAVVEWPLWVDLHAFAEAMHSEPLDGLFNGTGWHGLGLHDRVDDKDEEDNNNADEITGGTIFDKQNKDGEEESNEDDMLFGPPILGDDDDTTDNEFTGKSMPFSAGIVGLERCHIYEKVETGMSLYLNINRNQSHDCVLRAICESQLLADFYPYAPSSIFFEVIHLILKPSLGMKDLCFEKYLVAEKAAYKAPEHCTEFVSKCPLNIAGLFVRNFFPEIF